MSCAAIERYIAIKIVIEDLGLLASPEGLQIDMNLAVGLMGPFLHCEIRSSQECKSCYRHGLKKSKQCEFGEYSPHEACRSSFPVIRLWKLRDGIETLFHNNSVKSLGFQMSLSFQSYPLLRKLNLGFIQDNKHVTKIFWYKVKLQPSTYLL